MQDLAQLSPAPRLAVVDDAEQPLGTFPVGRVFCVGRNYAEHAREMGGDPDVEAPFFFMKPADAVCISDVVGYPQATAELHHEVELVVAWDGERVLGCGVGLDLTRRDRQAEMKAGRRPWEVGKVFPGAAPCGALRHGSAVLDDAEACISLEVNGEVRQQSALSHMIHDVEQLLAEIDALFGLRAGDLLFTGTPAGVAAVEPGDVLCARVDGLPTLTLTIAEAR